MNLKIHNALQAIVENGFITVDRGRRQHIPFQINIITDGLSHSKLFRIHFFQAVGHEKFHCQPFGFPFGRCGDGFLSLDTVFVFAKKNLYPPGSGRHFLCCSHSILLFQGIHYIPSLIVYTFSCNL